MDTLRAMQTFVQIVEAGSLTRAADALGVSAPSVVRALAALEAKLDTRLIHRTTRRMALTDAGREYLERCKRVLADIDEAHAALSARRRAPRGRLRITSSVLFGRLHVAPLVAEFLARHDDVQVDLLLLDRVVDLLEEGLDLAVRLGRPPDSSLVAVPVGATRRVVCASPAFIAKQGTPRKPEALRTLPAVVFSGLGGGALFGGATWTFERDGRALKVPVTARLATNQIDTAIDACVRGLGVGQFLHYQVAPALAQRKLVALLGTFEGDAVPIHLMYPQTRLLSANVRAFVDWAAPTLREQLGQKPVSARGRR